MRILQVMQFLTPTRGGSVTVPYDLIKALRKQGHEITLITTDFEYDPEYARALEGVEVLVFPCFANIGLFLYSPAMAGWLKRNLASFDVVHLHNFRTYQNIIVLRHARKKGIPLVVQAHGSAAIVEGKGTLKRAYDLLWGKKLIEHAKACVAVSDMEIPDYLELGADSTTIKVIPNGLWPDNLRPVAPRGEFRRAIGLGHDDKLILYVGRLNRRKGVDVLINVFALLRRDRKDAYLVIAGPDDGYEQKLKDIARTSGVESFIRFVGYIPDRASAYADADVLVYPSRHEIFGMVPFEAILCGTPVVVSNDCGCGQMIANASCGLAVPPGAEEALVSAIDKIIDDDHGAHEMVENGQRYIVENLDWNSIVQRVEEIYRDVIKEHRC